MMDHTPAKCKIMLCGGRQREREVDVLRLRGLSELHRDVRLQRPIHLLGERLAPEFFYVAETLKMYYIEIELGGK